VEVDITPSFMGSFKLSSSHDNITYSSGLIAVNRLFWEKDGLYHEFIMDPRTGDAGPTGWKGDGALLQSENGAVKIHFGDEAFTWSKIIQILDIKGMTSRLRLFRTLSVRYSPELCCACYVYVQLGSLLFLLLTLLNGFFS
jgi:hypothetical protein